MSRVMAAPGLPLKQRLHAEPSPVLIRQKATAAGEGSKGAMELGAWFGGFGLFSPWSLINGGYGAWGTHYTRTSWCCCLVQCFWWPSEWHLCEIKPRNSQDIIHFVCHDLQSAESSVQYFCKITFQVLKSSKFLPQGGSLTSDWPIHLGQIQESMTI